MAKKDETLQLGTFYIDGQLFGVNILHMREILRPQDLTKVPCSWPEVVGVINLRGIVIPVISLRVTMGVPVRPYDENTRIIIVRVHDMSIGLMVDAIGHVRQIRGDNVEEPPTVVNAEESAYLSGVYQDGDKIILLLALEHVVKAKVMEQFVAAFKLNQPEKS